MDGKAMSKRENNTGCIRKRKDGRWEGIYLTGEIKDGKSIRKSVFAKSKSECLKKLNKAIEEVEQAQQESSDCAFINLTEPTLQEWYEIWIGSFCYSSKKEYTKQGYIACFRRYILPTLGNVKINQISIVTCQKLFRDLFENGRLNDRDKKGPGLSAKTIKDVKIALHSCLQRAVDEGVIPNNPVQKVQLPKVCKKEMRTLKADEIGAFLAEAKNTGVYEFYVLEITTGLRLGEILALTWDDFDRKNKTIRINKQVQRIGKELVVSPPKTDAANRTLKLCDKCVTCLTKLKRKQKQANPKNLIFSSPITFKEKDPCSVTRMLHRIQKRAGLPRISFHDLRHSFATLALEKGQDIKAISYMLGHTDAGFTMNTYMHVTDVMQEKVAEALDNLISEILKRQNIREVSL